jgi:hypothetical protein
MSFGDAFRHLDYGSLLKSGYDAAEFGLMAGIGFGTSGLVSGLGWAGARGWAAGAVADIGLGVVGDTASARMSFGEAVAANALGFGLGEVASVVGRRVLTRAGRTLANQCSFSGDTSVATEDGDKPIREIEEGDEVLAYNEATGETAEYEVEAVWSHLDPVTVYVTIDGEEIETTPEHPFYTKERGWVAASDLVVGDEIRDAAGEYGAVEAVYSEQKPQPMYNLTVDEAHTFFVGDGQWLVHNTCGSYVEYGSTELSRVAQAFRLTLPDDAKRGGDVAVILTDIDLAKMQGFIDTYKLDNPAILTEIQGNMLITRNSGKHAHAEDIGMTLLNHSKNPLEIAESNILELYTEFSPCRQCTFSLRSVWPTVAESKVTWSFKFGEEVHKMWKNLSVASLLRTRATGPTGVTFLNAFDALQNRKRR